MTILVLELLPDGTQALREEEVPNSFFPVPPEETADIQA